MVEMVMKVLALAVGSGLVVEVVKWLWELVASTMPPKVVPIVASLIGTLIGWAADSLLPGLGVSPELGTVGGMLATVLHQVKHQPWTKPEA